MARRTSPTREVTPVEVSLCTTHTALMRLSGSARRRLSIASGSAPWRQSVGSNSTSSPSFAAIFCHNAASRGRYSTDASIYQVEPLGVVVPRTEEAARTALAVALEAGVPVLARGAGTSQCGQSVGAALVIDHSKFLNRIVEVDAQASR